MAKVLGLGNALVDIMTKLNDDALLDNFSLPKGSMQLVDKKNSNIVLDGTKELEKSQSSGGSAANTIHGLANLGVGAGFIGKVGDDEFGRFFFNDMSQNNIQPKLLTGKAETGLAIALVSPDSERTFATYLGAAIELSADDIVPETFHGFDYFHIEGYLAQNQKLIEKAVRLAKEQNLKVSLDLASFNVVEDNLDFLKTIINDYVDIIFANEEEAHSFTGKEPEDALNEIAKKCEIAIVKIGEKGSLIKKENQTHKIGIIDANSIDTTGAGDLYASGFLFGLTKGLSLDKCGEIGAILSGKVIEVIGSKMDDERWKEIHSLIGKVMS